MQSLNKERLRYPVYASRTEDVVYIDGENFHRRYQRRSTNAKPFVVYPPLGNIWVAMEFAMHSLGFNTISDLNKHNTPPVITERTKSLGAQDAPEGACFPLKATIGYFEEALIKFESLSPDQRINYYLLFLGHESTGTCRERAYSRIQEARLQDYSQNRYGHSNFDFYSVKDSRQGVYEFIQYLLKLTGNWRENDLRHNLMRSYALINLMSEGITFFKMAEDFESAVRFRQSLVASDEGARQSAVFHQANEFLHKAKIMLASSDVSASEKKRAMKAFDRELKQLTKPEEKPNRPKGVIAITGEIFHNEEMTSVSGDIGVELISRGFYYEKHSGIAHYVDKFNLSPGNLFKIGLGRLARENNPLFVDTRLTLARKGGLMRDVGGHSLDIVALVERLKEEQAKGLKSYDGIIELLPFGCLPEVVTANIMKLNGVNYLRLILDEHGGKAGLITRLEAYLDLVSRGKKTKHISY